MSKSIFGVENAKVYAPVLNEDGRWMVACYSGGTVNRLPIFLGKYEHAATIATVMSDREMVRYTTEISAETNRQMQENWPTLQELASRLGFTIETE